MSFGIDNQRWNVQRQPEVQSNPLAAEASALARNHPVVQMDSAISAMTPRFDAKVPKHAESNYVLKDQNQQLTGIDFAAAPNIYKSSFSNSAADHADQVINRALLG